jgi:hypothetical protein
MLSFGFPISASTIGRVKPRVKRSSSSDVDQGIERQIFVSLANVRVFSMRMTRPWTSPREFALLVLTGFFVLRKQLGCAVNSPSTPSQEKSLVLDDFRQVTIWAKQSTSIRVVLLLGQLDCEHKLNLGLEFTLQNFDIRAVDLGFDLVVQTLQRDGTLPLCILKCDFSKSVLSKGQLRVLVLGRADMCTIPGHHRTIASPTECCKVPHFSPSKHVCLLVRGDLWAGRLVVMSALF